MMNNHFWVFDENSLRQDLRKLVKAVCEIMVEIVMVDGASFMLYDIRKESLSVIVSMEGDEKLAREKIGIAVKLGDRVAGKVAQEKEPILIMGDVSKDERFSNFKKYQEIYSGISVPVTAGNRLIGVLNAKRTRSAHPLTTDDLKMLEKIAAILGKYF